MDLWMDGWMDLWMDGFVGRFSFSENLNCVAVYYSHISSALLLLRNRLTPKCQPFRKKNSPVQSQQNCHFVVI